MRIPSPGALAAALALAAGLCSPAMMAQSGLPFTQTFARIALGHALLDGSRNSINAQVAAAYAASQARAVPPPGGALASASFTYEPDPRLSDWTRLSMIDTLGRQDPDLRRQIESAFAGNAVLDDFDRFMSKRGYSSHDVADDTAELLLVSWQVATDQAATEAQRRGLHAQIRALFASSAQLRAMTNADRQLMGERIAYQVIITSSAHTQYERRGGTAEHAQLRQSAAAVLREHGVDLRQMRLTDQGFSK